jgi:pimeloyl-ACP methyl ester carboxylesterase
MEETIPLVYDELRRIGARKLRTERAVWQYSEAGSGRPLVLLHGIGMSRAAWNPVLPHLCRSRRVITFDVAGFGSTPPLPAGTLPTIPNLAVAFDQSLRGIGLTPPVDLAGNSLGGSIALELARRGIARSVVAISPPGLWIDHPPRHVKYVFRSLRFMAGSFPELVKATVRIPLLRELTLAIPISAGSRRMPVGDALRSVEDLAKSTAFEETFENTRAPLSAIDIAVPVTVAFGERDWILTKGARRREVLPAHTRWVEKPGWGHVPMWVDPVGVSQLILDGTESHDARRP